MKRDSLGLAIPRHYKLGRRNSSWIKLLHLIERFPGSYLVELPDGEMMYLITPHEYNRTASLVNQKLEDDGKLYV